MDTVVLTLAGISAAVGLFIWLFVYIVPPNTLGIPVFFGKRKDHIMKEGLNIYLPFCTIVERSLEPRPRVDFSITVNALNGQLKCSGKFGFRLLSPEEMREEMDRCGIANVRNEKNYLLLFYKKEKQIEGDADARIKEMLDEQLGDMHVDCALRNKQLNDAVQLALEKGIKYKEKPDGPTAEQKIISLVDSFRKKLEESYEKGIISKVPDIPLPEERDLPEYDANTRGIERIFLEDYGVSLDINTLTLEPDEETAHVRGELQKREIQRSIEETDTDLVTRMIKKVIDQTGLDPKEARELVMVVQDYYQKPDISRYEIDLKGLEKLHPDVATALASMVRSGALFPSAKEGGDKKKKGGRK